LKVYNAISKTEDVKIGGTTKPWVVTVDTSSGIKEYLVKLFSGKGDKQYQPTNKEFYASAIAEDLDLSVPSYALIYFDEEFLDTLTNEEKNRIQEIGRKYFFGCELITKNSNYSDALTNKHLETYDIENIFAFDVLIRNVDRREKKPNIFFQESTYYLIDHEQSLNVDRDFIHYFNESRRWEFIYKDIKGSHLFYKRLKKNKKYVSFDTFEFLLNGFSLNKIDQIEVLLKNKGFDTTDYFSIRSYLENIRINQPKFITLLHELIQ
jgi:hypothetical protein